MKFIKNVFSQLHSFILCALLSVIFWGWIFTLISDTTPAKKVTLVVNAWGVRDQELTLRLEQNKPASLKMIKVHDQDYYLVGQETSADLYILPESRLASALEENTDNVAEIECPTGMEAYVYQDRIFGIKVFDAAARTGVGEDYITYLLDGDPEPENYYLCFSTESLHLKSLPGALDNAAWEVAMEFLSISSR